MLANFRRPSGEKPYYFSSTVENGKVVKHDGDINHAVYKSEMDEISRRANLWHAWVEKNHPEAYDGLGTLLNSDIPDRFADIRIAFMEGERSE